ncbi:ribonuclease-like 3 [Rhinichthys klamathensis goyatoka]|uniref:ribonuclease-like 3 n=1 Tax=Rhinichthys klamathensis goyatoka TaxID=3034132 RepID=UPI0024B5D438|nr:ribonuclease-like 3 [Rhinichthys klamathensis goyatoka]XP_056109145.1 ribonuclease-like 3 [Rhinichthys klamathensis goyatoka]
MEIHQSAVILLLLLCVSFSTHAQPDNIKPRYQKFLDQHFGPDMTEQRCNSEMNSRNRDITGTDGGCKDVNTFIQANSKDIRKVCGAGGTPQGGNLFKSNQPFPVITCKLPNGRPPRCDYGKGKKSTRYIVLGCAEGWPVHYDEGKLNL